jgi:hypothetical protein
MPRANHLLAVISIGLIAVFLLILIVERIVLDVRRWLRTPRRRVSPPHVKVGAETASSSSAPANWN